MEYKAVNVNKDNYVAAWRETIIPALAQAIKEKKIPVSDCAPQIVPISTRVRSSSRPMAVNKGGRDMVGKVTTKRGVRAHNANITQR